MNLLYTKEVEVIWADMDPNQHMRHTSYSQYAAHARISFFNDMGYPLTKLAEMGLGAVLLREESTYFREVHLHEKIKISVELLKSTSDFCRYTIVQTINKENGKTAAKVIIDGTWIDMKSRKVTTPFQEVIENVINKLPIHKSFEWVEASFYRFS
jgi:acyl-CoA thioester hydrolase